MNFNKIFVKIFGSRNERLLKRYWRVVEQINGLEPKVSVLTDEQLKARTLEIHEGLMEKKITREEVMPEAFAIIRESMDRNIGIRSIFSRRSRRVSGEVRSEPLDAERANFSTRFSKGWRRIPANPI